MSIKMRILLLFLIFINGYVSLSLELIAMRQISFFVGSSAVVTSIIIGVFLGFMSWGYFRGAGLRPIKVNVKKFLATSFLIIAVMTILACSFQLVAFYFEFMYRDGIVSSIGQTFIYSLVFLSAAPFLFGFNTAILSRYLHRYSRNYTGKIMAWDTIGSVFGSLATTLIFMPFVGVNYTMLLIVFVSIAGACISNPKPINLIWFPIILIPAWLFNSDAYLYKKYNMVENNANSTIMISGWGSEKTMIMNGLPMSVYNKTTKSSAEYVNYINNNFIYTIPSGQTKDILILGAGGFTMGIEDTRNNYTFVDIEKTLKNVSEEHFLDKKLTPNKKFIVQDASQFLKNTPDMYDIIILDVYSNSFRVPADLITVEFMERIKARVRPDGIVLMNIICDPAFGDEFSRNFDNTMRAVFNNNINRQVITSFNPWKPIAWHNIVYSYYNKDNTQTIYTNNKNSVIYDR